MSNLLPTWRQRIGAMVLAIALMLAGAWLRGFVNEDFISMDDREERVLGLGDNSLILGSYRSSVIEEADGRKGIDFEFVQALEIPYWSILLPLCLLSAYLLLTKPRSRTVDGSSTECEHAKVAIS